MSWAGIVQQRRNRWLSAVFLLLAIAGHFFYWYAPRSRPALPAGGLTERLLAHPGLPLSVWMPYPHQNLAILHRRFGVDLETLRAALKVAELPDPSLPKFGSFTVPPARSLALATDSRGEQFLVAADIYPSVAWFSRLAGSLAGNPWLAGGDLIQDEQRLSVRWHGNVWTVANDGTAPFDSLEPSRKQDSGAACCPSRGALLVANAERAKTPLPVGRYYLFADDQVLDFVSAEAEESAADKSAAMAEADALLYAVAARETPLGAAGQAMILIGQDEEQIAELPHGALVFRQGVKRWKLPAEGVLRMAGRDLHSADVGDFRLISTAAAGLSSGRRLASDSQQLLTASGHGALIFGLWLQVEPTAVEVHRIRRGLERAPIMSNRMRRRWRGADRFLTGLADRWQTISLTVSDSPASLWLRVQSSPESEEPPEAAP